MTPPAHERPQRHLMHMHDGTIAGLDFEVEVRRFLWLVAAGLALALALAAKLR
jgi:hypothetical protein